MTLILKSDYEKSKTYKLFYKPVKLPCELVVFEELGFIGIRLSKLFVNPVQPVFSTTK